MTYGTRKTLDETDLDKDIDKIAKENGKEEINKNNYNKLGQLNDRRRLREFSNYKIGDHTVLESESDMANYNYVQAKTYCRFWTL